MEFLERWQATFLAILLFSLAFRLGIDGVHPNLIDVLVVTGLEISSRAPPAPPGWPVAQTTPSTTEEEAAEEEEDPGGYSEPDGVAN